MRSWLLLPLLLSTLSALAGPLLERDHVPATGEQHVVFELNTFGRYAVIANSSQGTSVQVVDRMTGPGAIHGQAGSDNGRYDGFFEQGDYKIIARSSARGTGEAAVRVVPFKERNKPRVRLRRLQPIQSDLGDFEQRSWWIELDGASKVALEATGRHLTDLRIWRDGTWLEAVKPTCTTYEPVPGQPQRDCAMVASLPAGLYQVKVYGGESEPWTTSSQAKPLHLQWGVPTHGDTLRQTRVMGPQGFERFHLGRASYVRIELPKNAPAKLEIGRGSRQNPYGRPQRSAAITNKTRLPVAEVELGGASKVVTVRATPGQRYTLQHFAPMGRTASLTGSGEWFLGTVHAGDIGDSIVPTGVVYRTVDKRMEVLHSAAIYLPGASTWSRRFNLLEPTRILLRVDEPTTLRANVEGKVSMRIEPFMLRTPKDYQQPTLQTGPLEQRLDPGHYALTLHPEIPGIASLTVQTKTWGSWAGAGSASVTPRPSIQFHELPLHASSKVLYREPQPGVRVGHVLRKLPVDLAQPLPVTLQPGERMVVASRATSDGVLTVTDANGAAWPFEVNGSTSLSTRRGAGVFNVGLHNASDKVAQLSVQHTPTTRLPNTPLPYLTPKQLNSLPVFPSIIGEAPTFSDLGRTQQKTWLVQVQRPGLYQFQSEGLLHTSANVRTRTRLGFASSNGDGPGRNFMIERYLGTGTYQVSVRAQGNSAGHLAIRLKRTDLVDGGVLEPGIPARISLPKGRAVSYAFHSDGEHPLHVRSAGRGFSLKCRIEDKDGWPVTAPVVNCDRRLTLRKGSYRVIVLPSTVDTRRVTVLSEDAVTEGLEGHGPHSLALSARVAHTWRESQERTPDAWTFEVPAQANVRVDLSDEMVADVYRGDQKIGRIVPGSTFEQRLDRGAYRLMVRAARKDDLLEYKVSVNTMELVRGQRREVSLPADLPIAVGGRELLTLYSFGNTDVRARLYKGDEVIASNDDRPDDWNFSLTERLHAGTYRLRIDKVAGSSRTTVALEARPTATGRPLATGTTRTLILDRKVHVLPMSTPRTEVVVAQADSRETVQIALEAKVSGSWATLGTATGRAPRLAVRKAAQPATAWRLRVRSLDDRGNPVKVRVDAQQGATVSETTLASGLRLRGGKGMQVVRVDSARPGLFAVSASRDVRLCTSLGSDCKAVDGPIVAVGPDGLWLAGTDGNVRLRRARATDEPVVVPVPRESSVYVDLPPGVGPVVVMANAPAGQPGVQLVNDVSTPHRADRMGVAPYAAAAISLDGQVTQARVWSADDRALQARLTASRFAPPTETGMEQGVNALMVPAGAARRFLMPTGPIDLQVALQRGLLASLGSENAVLWANNAAIEEHLPQGPNAITVFNPTDKDRALRLVVRPAQGAALSLEDGLVEHTAGQTGSWRADVPAGGSLRLRGDVQHAILQRLDGRVVQGLDLDVGPGGVLRVQHGPGTVLAWTEATGKPSGPWLDIDAVEHSVAAHARVHVHGQRGARLALNVGEAGMVQVQVSSPVAARIEVPGQPTRVRVLQQGGSVVAWLPNGTGHITLRGLTGGTLVGHAAVSTHRPTALDEGPGPPVLMTPGGMVLYSFEVQRDGKVGIGVRADADRVDAVIYDINGTSLGEGIVQMPDLKAGRYLLAMRLPPSAPPVRAQPVLVGISPPDTTPPEHILRTYLTEPTR